MTATLPTGGPSVTGGPPRVRLDARPGFVYGYRIHDTYTRQVRIDYVGQTRNLARRDGQHRGLIRQRDGRFREQPWADLIEGGPVVLDSGVWTDAELDAAEVAHMHRLLPRMNMKDSVTPYRIPIYTQREQRDARDIALGLPPRDWNGEHGPGLNRPAASRPVPGQSRDGLLVRLWATRTGRHLSAWLHRAATVCAWWAVLTIALAVGLTVWGRLPLKDAAGTAAVIVAVLLGGALYLFRSRRGGRTNRRRRT